jgi:Flp pilus assembly pilin Flp
VSTILLSCLLGALVGLGVFALIRALSPSRRSAAARVAEIDAMRAAGPAGGPEPRPTDLRGRIGHRVALFYLEQGWELRSLRSDLAVLDRSWESFLATKVMLSAFGLVFGPFVFAAVLELGLGLNPIIPVWLALLFAIVFFFLPDLEVRRDAAKKRKDLRRVIGAYLDLVSMNLAGGRGLPEALMAAAEVSDGWALLRIRNCLSDARITGTTQWVALGRLGAELGIEELTDLSVTLGLVAGLARRDHAAPRTRRDRGQGRRELAVHARRPAPAVRGLPRLSPVPRGHARVPSCVSKPRHRTTRFVSLERTWTMDGTNSFRKVTHSVASFVKRRFDQARSRDGRSRGASAVEWVIISAIVAALVAGVGYAISQAVQTKTDKVQTCIDKADTSKC